MVNFIPKKQTFQIPYEDLTKVIDVDASDGRSVPINMNFVDQGYLTKDTGFTLFGITEDDLCHSLFNYKKKDGTHYVIRAKGTKLQQYNYFDRTWSDITGSPTFTEGAEFAFYVYGDILYIGNAYESLYSWNGATFTEFASAPKGNIMTVFEDRLSIAGVRAQPLTVYYSNVGVPTTFTPTDIVQPLGTDSIMGLENYYGVLMTIKQNSIWKLTFVYDQIVSLYVPKLEIQTNNYGACSRKAVTWVENDLWFFTGTEVRSIGYKTDASGVLGVSPGSISQNIEETLKLIDIANYNQCTVAYNDRRFYLAVPIGEDTNNTTFVCHLLYSRAWTKYSDRDKARVNSFLFIDGVPYTSSASAPYGTIDWQVDTEDTESINNALITE